MPLSRNDSVVVMHDEIGLSRGIWGSRFAYLLSIINGAVGLGKIWRFPYLVFKNGGGAFLIPYITVMLIVGLPLTILELSLGKIFKQGIVGSLKSVSKRFIGIGVFHVFTTVLIMSFYTVIIGWMFWYAFAGLVFDIPFSKNPSEYFNHLFNIPKKIDPHNISIQLETLGFLILVWILIFFVSYKGIWSLQWAMLIWTPIWIALFILFAVQGFLSEGWKKGISFYFIPQFENLVHPNLWIDAFGHVFFSLGLAGGTLPSLSSYTKPGQNIVHDAFILVIFNMLIEIFCGMIIFCYLGNISFHYDIKISDLPIMGSELLFIVLPKVAQFTLVPKLFVVSFFLMTIFMGLTTAIALNQGFYTTILDKYPRFPKKLLAILICSWGLLTSLVYNTNIGFNIIDVVDYYSGLMLLIGGISMCISLTLLKVQGKYITRNDNQAIVFEYLYQINLANVKIKRKKTVSFVELIRHYINATNPSKLPFIWTIVVSYIAPFLLIFVLAVYFFFSFGYKSYPQWFILCCGYIPFFCGVLLSLTISYRDKIKNIFIPKKKEYIELEYANMEEEDEESKPDYLKEQKSEKNEVKKDTPPSYNEGGKEEIKN